DSICRNRAGPTKIEKPSLLRTAISLTRSQLIFFLFRSWSFWSFSRRCFLCHRSFFGLHFFGLHFFGRFYSSSFSSLLFSTATTTRRLLLCFRCFTVYFVIVYQFNKRHLSVVS